MQPLPRCGLNHDFILPVQSFEKAEVCITVAGEDRCADRTRQRTRFSIARAEGERAPIRAVQHDQIDVLGMDGQARDGLESTAVSCQERFIEQDVLVWLG